MARNPTCPACRGDHFKRVIVTLPSGRDRDTDFVYCCRCLVMLYRDPGAEGRLQRRRQIDESNILPMVGVAAINEALRKLPDPNNTQQNSAKVTVLVDYQGNVSIEFGRFKRENDGRIWHFWVAKSATKVTA